MNTTKIPYLTHTWNPIAMQCSPCSPACQNCWHLAMAKRMARNPKIAPEIRAAYAGDVPPLLIQERLTEPLERKSPAVIGVQFMGDLWHESISFSSIANIWQIMSDCPRHTFIILTKRVDQAFTWFKKYWSPGVEPLQNIAIGTTCENQKQANMRIPTLLQITARWHWVSYEPALNSVDFTNIRHDRVFSNLNALTGKTHDLTGFENVSLFALDLIVAGCESGPNRRPSNPDWFRSVRDQCKKSETSFFLKQAEVGGKVVEMPELYGQVWNQLPWRWRKNQ